MPGGAPDTVRYIPCADPRGALEAVLAAPFTRAGRFRRVALPGGAACVPLALSQNRLGAVGALRAALPVAGAPHPRAAFRLATALRQSLWRRLRHRRGLVPAAAVVAGSGGWTATLWACQLDVTLASPDTLDALEEIFQDAALRQSLAWASRARPRSPRPPTCEGA